MNIAAMNVRITIQKSEASIDKIGNHKLEWKDFYTCWATPVQSGGTEAIQAGTINSQDALDFTVRYSKKLANLDSTKIRILLKGVLYNVIAIDQMGFKHNSIKFKCEKVKR